VVKTLNIYTDGSCPVNPGPGGWAYVILRDDANVYGSGYNPVATNNTMELWAALEALRKVKELGLRDERVRVTTDSQYLVQGMQNWRHIWEHRDFEEVKNGDIWRRLHIHATKIKDLRFMWVKGHKGNTWNEWCDAAAGQAVKDGNAGRALLY
jgi:ribonuclease HI